MHYPSTRLLTVLDLLQTRSQMSGAELAAELEVDARTVRRYITMLQEAGVPIETIKGRYGGYRLEQGYKLPPVVFHTDEILALSLALVLARESGITHVLTAAEGAMRKMEQVMPAGLREQMVMIEEALSVVPKRPPQTLPSTHFMTLSRAVYEKRCVWLSYQAAASGVTKRKVEPYGLVHIIGMWYMTGYCHLREGLRTFRLDRIVECKRMMQTFEPPADFDPLMFVEQSIAKTPGIWRAELLLKTTLADARRMIPLATAVLQETADGVLMTHYSNEPERFAHHLLGLPCDFVILSPPELREQFLNLAQRARKIADQFPE